MQHIIRILSTVMTQLQNLEWVRMEFLTTEKRLDHAPRKINLKPTSVFHNPFRTSSILSVPDEEQYPVYNRGIRGHMGSKPIRLVTMPLWMLGVHFSNINARSVCKYEPQGLQAKRRCIEGSRRGTDTPFCHNLFVRSSRCSFWE